MSLHIYIFRLDIDNPKTLSVQDCVRVDIGDEAVISKRLEDIRLMESRKSARLVNSDTDFSLLADFNIVEQVRRYFCPSPKLCTDHSIGIQEIY